MALADPTRRRLFNRLRRRPHAVRELVTYLKITQPAVSQHLKVLKRARLVRVRADGQKRIYGLDPMGLSALRKEVDAMWNDALSAYADSFKEPQ
jgi:DNA-binding transcriptional ArsR family regulator